MMKNSEILVNFKNLHVYFKSKKNIIQAIRGIDFKVSKGQVIGVVGESGSGKSVLVRSIIGFNPNSRVMADRMVINEYDDDDKKTIHKIINYKERNWQKIRGRLVSYIPQNPLSSLNPTKKIHKQLEEAFIVSDRKFTGDDPENQDGPTRTIYERMVEILEFMGINDPIKVLKSYPHELSGGMRQRIVIAITVAMKPDLIIADEPTTALDVSVQAKVIDIIKKVNRELKIAVVFISHDISLVANFVDYVYVLYAGKILEKGKTSEVFGDPRHPYTWALLSAIPDRRIEGKLAPIPGSPPNLVNPPIGDVFAARNKYAMKIDFEKEPRLFQITKTHFAATWLLHPQSPKVELDDVLIKKLEFIRRSFVKGGEMPTSTLMNSITNKLPKTSSFYGLDLGDLSKSKQTVTKKTQTKGVK